MSFIRGGETVQIKRRTANGVDEYGNTAHTFETITIKDVLIGLGGGKEPVMVDRDPIDQTITAYFPEGTVILEGDRFTIRGLEFVKAAAVEEWVSPFGTTNFQAGVVVALRRRIG